MKFKLLIILLCFCTNYSVGQNNDIETLKANGFNQRQDIDALDKKVKNQQYLVNQLKSQITNLTDLSKQQSQDIDSLVQLIEKNNINILGNTNALKSETARSNSNYKELNSSLSQNQLFWILGTVLLLGLGFFIYYLLGRRIASNQQSTEGKIKDTRKIMEEESIKLDSKLVEVLETQLKLKEEELKLQSTASSNNKVDHSLALKVADEIIRIRKNLGRMDGKTKGLKQLTASVKRIENNFKSKGYEIVEMLGMEYKEGMRVIANFVPSEEIETGKEIITRIIKPQVNFNGVMIQSAQIDVSVGE